MVVGSVLLALFLVSDLAKNLVLGYLLAGAGLFLIGFTLWRKSLPPPKPSGRFSVFQKGRENSRPMQPEKKADNKPAGKADGKPAGKPDGKPAAKPANPAGQKPPAGKPGSKPAAKRSS